VEDIVIPDKSIAVRPFWNESTEKENEFFVNGMTEDIRNMLSKISDLRVVSRGSVEKYRDPKYTTKYIARDLNVIYVLEGTAQRIVNQVKIHVQLILAENDDHVWDTAYIEDIKDVIQVFNLQSQIAQSVAKAFNGITQIYYENYRGFRENFNILDSISGCSEKYIWISVSL
jgi:TolB-like protein